MTRTCGCLSGVAASMWTDERTPGCRRNGVSVANTLGRWPGWSCTSSRASRSARRPSIIGRTSSIVSRRLTLVAIWKSAAFGSSPPITPCSISSSTRSIMPGSASRSRRALSSVAWLKRRAAAAMGATVRAAIAVGMPSFAPSRYVAAVERSCFSAAQMSRRATGWSTSSPHCSAASTSRRRSRSAGKSGGDGTSASSASAICLVPWTFAPSILSAGTVFPENPSALRSPRCAAVTRSMRR